MSVSLADVVSVLEELYPLSLAESWDEPGLIVGDPGWGVSKIYCAVDPTEETVQAAIDTGADLLITHHPLYFRATHTVAGSTFRGAMVTKLIENQCALWVGHTNVDCASRGQGLAFVKALDLTDCGPLVPSEKEEGCGLGRIGEVKTPMTLREFANELASALPQTHAGILVSGELDQNIQRIAVLPGSGDSEVEAAAKSGADVYVTSDLRHHPVLDARQETGMAFINTPHAAIENLAFTLMRDDVPAALARRFGQNGAAIEMEVSQINTDPWDLRI